MLKETVRASSDVALIKYWGKRNEELRLPENGSISMILSGLDTVTTVEFNPELKEDTVMIQGESNPEEQDRVREHLDRIRHVAGVTLHAKVESKNTFPKGTGLSSSGSGFAALTIAAAKALGLTLDQRRLSIIARQGSGTACRCVCEGFVEWKDGKTSEESYSETIFPVDHWDIRDVVAIVDEGKKSISSTSGHQSARTSPFYQARLAKISEKIETLKQFIQDKDFRHFGELVEQEALEFHSILLTSNPPLIAWYPGTLEVMRLVQAMRSDGVEAYFTINTGFNVHVLTMPKSEPEVRRRLLRSPLVRGVLHASVGNEPEIQDVHLF